MAEDKGKVFNFIHETEEESSLTKAKEQESLRLR